MIISLQTFIVIVVSHLANFLTEISHIAVFVMGSFYPHHGGAAAGYYQAHGHWAYHRRTGHAYLISTSMVMYHALGLGQIRWAVAP